MKNSVSKKSGQVGRVRPVIDPEVAEFGKDLGLIHEVIVTGRKVGMKRRHYAALAHDEDMLEKVLDVLENRASIVYPEHLIDCDAKPYVPTNWNIAEHQKDGVRVWDPTKVTLYLNDRQKVGKCIDGYDLRNCLAEKSVLNANVLDYLLKTENQHLIPQKWKCKRIFFWGTIYSQIAEYLCVRCLNWEGKRWSWSFSGLFYNFDDNGPAAVSES